MKKWKKADLSFYEVSDPNLGHDRDSNRLDDFLDHFRVALCTNKYGDSHTIESGTHHACDSTVRANVSRHTLECHDGASLGMTVSISRTRTAIIRTPASSAIRA